MGYRITNTLPAILLVVFAAIGINAQSEPRGKFDEFGEVNAEDAMARLDAFALDLKSHPESRGIIVAHNVSSDIVPRGTFLRLAHGYRNYLVKTRGLEDTRISVVEGQQKQKTSFELWRLPANELSTVSEETRVTEPPAPQLFDSIMIDRQCFGDLPIELYEVADGLQIFSRAMSQYSRAKIWIVIQPRMRDSRATTLALLNLSRKLLIRNGVKAERMLTEIAASRSSSCGQVNLWLVPESSTKADETGYYSQLIDEADSTEYNVRRVEFIGNAHVRDNTLRRRMKMNEGDIFSRKLLDQSLKNLSSLGLVYPVTVAHVEPRLDRENKIIDFTIYFRERPRRK